MNIRKIACIICLLLLTTSSSHAINVFEKTLYRKVFLQRLGAQVLVNPLTGQLKYVWCRSSSTPEGGFWMPLVGPMKKDYQAVYKRQNEK